MSSKKKEEADYEEYESLKQSKFKQQKLPGWRPTPSMSNAILFFFSLGILSVAIGVTINFFSDEIVEKEINYNNKTSVIFNVSKKMKKDIMVYYKVYNFYQNNRRFMNSRSEDQLKGKNITLEDMKKRHECDPIITNKDLRINLTEENLNENDLAYPCGLIARSFILFNDSFSFGYVNGSEIPINETNIARRFDRENYKIEHNLYKPWLNIEDEHFLVWMRTSPFANFTKLYGRIPKDIEPNKNIIINITHGKYYNETEYEDSRINKSIIITTVNSFGGKNTDLAFSYLIFGGLCMIIGIAFIIGFKCHEKQDKQ